MSTLQTYIKTQRESRPILLMTHVIYGYPTIKDSLEIMETLLREGTDILEVQFPFSDPVATFTYHRSFSHSLITLALLTPLMVWLIRKIHPIHAQHRMGWYALVYLAFATHVLLDAFTIYGTQIFWPVSNTPMTTRSAMSTTSSPGRRPFGNPATSPSITPSGFC